MDGGEQRSRPTTSSHTAFPLAQLPDSVAARVQQAGAPGVNLYRALAHAPRLLEAWIDFAWALRERCDTPRRLRELVILRTAQLMLSPYEWTQHRLMAVEAGVGEHQVAELPMWHTSPAFTDAERAALALTDALVDGHVPDQVNATVDEYFGPQARVELTLTAAFYCAVPRLLDALRVPVEGSNSAPTEQGDSEDDQVNATVDEYFGPQARVELTLTAAFYCAVPRLLDALRVPVEGSNSAPTEQGDSEEDQE